MFQDDNSFGAFIEYLHTKYQVKICEVLIAEWIMSDGTFQLIERVVRKHSNLKILGNEVTFTMPNKTDIILRPQLTMIEDLFDIKMLLIKLSDEQPIQVQFNVECPALDDYYTSIHPRWMDAQNYNSW
eukprot:168969_1